MQLAAPRLGCVTASSLGGTNSVEIEVAADDVALIQFSSGTTNDPKPVALTHANLLSNLAAIERYLTDEGAPNPVGVTWLPLYHDMGLIGNLLSAFYFPAPLVLLPPELFVAIPGAWLRAISRHRGTVTAAPNFAFGLCLKRIRDDELDGVDLSSWRVSLNGAEAVSAAVQRRFNERFGRWGLRASALTPCYGMAEASLGVTFKPAGTSFRTLGVDAEKLALEGVVAPGTKELVSVGRPLAGVEVEIRDAAGVSLPPGRVGHIFVRGPSVMAGYFARTDLTDQAIHDGWLDSGDLGFTHDGELFVCGRHKDIIVVRGANHAARGVRGSVGVATRRSYRMRCRRGIRPRRARMTRRWPCSSRPLRTPPRRWQTRWRRESRNARRSGPHTWSCWHRARCRAPAAESCDGARRAPSGWQARCRRPKRSPPQGYWPRRPTASSPTRARDSHGGRPTRRRLPRSDRER